MRPRLSVRSQTPYALFPHRCAAALLVALLGADAFARAGGGGNFGGGGGGDGGGAIAWLFIQLLRLCFYHPVIGLPLMALFVYCVWRFYSRTKTAYTGSVIRRGGVAANVNASADAAAKLGEKDPAFDPAAFFG